MASILGCLIRHDGAHGVAKVNGGTRRVEACQFCEKFDREVNPQCEHARGPYDEIIVETEGLIVVPSLGCLTEGHLLIVTKRHFPSMGSLSDKLFAQFVKLKEDVRCLLSREYSPPIFFEHGAGSRPFTAGSCIDHAHCHAIPVPSGIDFVSEIRRHFSGHPIEHILALVNKGRAGEPYLFFEDSSGTKYVFDAEVVPCQYFRQLIAVGLGIQEEWDWRTYPGVEKALITIGKLRLAVGNGGGG